MMRHLVIAGWILFMTGCVGPDGMHRLALSMGTTVQGPFPLPPDFHLTSMEFPKTCEVQAQEIPVDPFIEKVESLND